MKWKDKLLSSGLPLELEVGQRIAEKNFFIDFDYSYMRLDEKDEKEFSVDISAGAFFPLSDKEKIKAELELITECKYRNPNISWLFIQDINPKNYELISTKGVLKKVDEFSNIHSRLKIDIGLILKTCQKGIEINKSTGEVHDRGIHHGINQLTYCLPTILMNHISKRISSSKKDYYPLFLCPILVTNAELRILDKGASLNSIIESKTIEAFSTEVPYLKMHSEVYPSFIRHCKNTFKEIPYQNKEFDKLNKIRKLPLNENGMPFADKLYSQPSKLINGLKNGYETDFFKQIIVCNLKHFDELMDLIINDIEEYIENFEILT